MRSVMRLVARRGWIVVLTAVAAVWVAGLAVGDADTRARATAVLLVPSGASASGPGNAFEANQLAANYAELIPLDDGVVTAIQRRIDLTPSQIHEGLSVYTMAGTSMLVVTFDADDPATALGAVRVIAAAVTGRTATLTTIPPGTVRLVRIDRPEDVVTVVGDDPRAVAAIVGLLVGFALAAAWERADARVHDGSRLQRVLGCPVTDLDGLASGSVAVLVEQWRAALTHPAGTIALLGGRPGQWALTEAAAARIAHAVGGVAVPSLPGSTSRAWALPGDVHLVAGGAPGRDESGEVVAFAADLVVLVVRRGTRDRTLDRHVADLAQVGLTVGWALLVPRQPMTHPAPALRVPEPVA